MFRSFRVKGDDIGTGLGKIGNDPVHRFHHQMHVDRRVGVRTDRRANHGTDREVGDIVIVHHIKVNPVSPRRDHVGDLFAQSGKISRKNARRNDVVRRRHVFLQSGRIIPCGAPARAGTGDCCCPQSFSTTTGPGSAATEEISSAVSAAPAVNSSAGRTAVVSPSG